MRLTPEIIAGMQQLALDQRRLLGDRAPWHVGDVAWGLRQHDDRESEWSIRLWVEDGAVVAWSWLKRDGRNVLEFDVRPERLELLDEILADPRAVEPLPALPELPEGFRYRTVRADDVAERVAIHRDVWEPSRVTEASYAQDEGGARAIVYCQDDTACALYRSIGFDLHATSIGYAR